MQEQNSPHTTWSNLCNSSFSPSPAKFSPQSPRILPTNTSPNSTPVTKDSHPHTYPQRDSFMTIPPPVPKKKKVAIQKYVFYSFFAVSLFLAATVSNSPLHKKPSGQVTILPLSQEQAQQFPLENSLPDTIDAPARNNLLSHNPTTSLTHTSPAPPVDTLPSSTTTLPESSSPTPRHPIFPHRRRHQRDQSPDTTNPPHRRRHHRDQSPDTTNPITGTIASRTPSSRIFPRNNPRQGPRHRREQDALSRGIGNEAPLRERVRKIAKKALSPEKESAASFQRKEPSLSTPERRTHPYRKLTTSVTPLHPSIENQANSGENTSRLFSCVKLPGSDPAHSLFSYLQAKTPVLQHLFYRDFWEAKTIPALLVPASSQNCHQTPQPQKNPPQPPAHTPSATTCETPEERPRRRIMRHILSRWFSSCASPSSS